MRDRLRLVPPAKRLRRVQTDAERRLWSRLRFRRLYGAKFRRQYPMGRTIVDFCCPEHKLVVEIDGGGHRKAYLQDRARDQALMGRGYQVLRFWNSDVLKHTDRVMRKIALAIRTLSPVPSPPNRGRGRSGMAAAALFLVSLSTLFLGVVPTTTEAAARPIQITADVVTATDHGQTLEARGHVLVTDGRITIRADRILYVRRTARIQLTGHVRVTTPQGELQAGEATAQLTRANALDAIEASGGVTAQSVGRTLKADRVTYQPKGETLTATGRVVLASSDLTITGETLVAQGDNSATVTGRPRIQSRDGFIEGDRLEAAIRAQIGFLRGNVVGVFSETRITSASATLLAKENKAVFRDNVTVTRPDRTMTAALVTYYYKEKRIVAEGQTTIKIRQPP